MEILKCFSKYKSRGRNRWAIEFFLHFFYLLGDEIVVVIEDTRIFGVVPELLSLAHITLIPNKYESKYYNDYRPTSMCNLIYKIITRIIFDKIKLVLGRFIFRQSFWIFSK